MATLRYDCPHCNMNSMAFRVIHAATFRSTHRWTAQANCGGCGKPLALIIKHPNSTNPPHAPDYDIVETGGYLLEQVWPQSKVLAAPQYVDPAPAARFVDGEDAFGRGRWNAAVAMYRASLDLATKTMDGVPSGKFFTRLKWMAENGKITPEIRSWADHVRVDGNEALHDTDDFDEKDAKALRYFTEMFLRYVFELPGEIRAYRKEVEPPKEGSVSS